MEPFQRYVAALLQVSCENSVVVANYPLAFLKQDYIPSIIDTQSKSIVLPEGQEVQLELWDSSSQEYNERLRTLRYADAHAILICFAIDSRDSLVNVVDKVRFALVRSLTRIYMNGSGLQRSGTSMKVCLSSLSHARAT